MQLSVPQRGKADRDSFPVEPAAVEQWLAGLSLTSENDAREIHRGLKHSNRLHNDPVRRRAVLECFLPVLHELHARFVELTRAQPLPLVREFAREVALVEALLREEAFAFKILLADDFAADTGPADTDPGAVDACRAMHALVRRADVIVQGYRRLPDALFEDAHALYCLASSPALDDHYRYLLLLAVADTRQLRVRQLPLALDFLRTAAKDLVLEPATPGALAGGPRTFAVDLALGTRPERVASLLVNDTGTLRLFDVTPVLARIDREIAGTRTTRGNTFGVDVLERQTLGRLRTAFACERTRRGSRTVTHLVQPALFGHKEISTHLLYEPQAADPLPARSDDADPTSQGVDDWALINRSSQGGCLHHPTCLPGTVQVGELVSLNAPHAEPETVSAGGRAATLLGTVRWVRSDGGSGVTLGVEYLARGVMPVTVVPTTTRADPAAGDADRGVAENALIIACRVQQSIVQTILLPPYLFEVGARLTARQGHRSRRLRLQTSLQSNGLFGHFVIE